MTEKKKNRKMLEKNVYWKWGGGGKYIIITTICELSCVEAA